MVKSRLSQRRSGFPSRSKLLVFLLSFASLLMAIFAPIQINSLSPSSALADVGVTITVNKLDCTSYYGRDFSQLAANCAPPSYQAEFQVYGPDFTQFYTGSFSQSGVTAGQYRIREIIPTGYTEPLVYCTFTDGQGNSNSKELITYDGYLELQVDAGVTLSCQWYNIPLQQAPAYGKILINKHFCKGSSEFDAYSASIYDLAANCNEPVMNVDFSALQNGTDLQDGTSTGAPNLLTFANLPIGTITIVESIPDGYGDPIVYCSVKDELGNDRTPVTQAPVDNDRINWNLQDGDVVFCDWFNVPAPLRVSITVFKYNCPDSIGYAWGGYSDYAQGCTSAAQGISFKLDSASTGNPGNQETDANGQYTWSDMDADHYYLTEEVPDGYQQPVVFCAYYLSNASPQNQDFQPYSISSDNKIEFDLQEGQNIVCVWFDISNNWSPATATPTPPPPTPTRTSPPPPTTATATSVAKKPTLIIHQRICVAGYDSFAQNADPKTDCTELPDQVSFKFAPLSGSGNGTTTPVDNTGTVTFANVEVGSYRLTQIDIPLGTSAFIQTCSSTGRDLSTYPLTPFAIVDANGSVALALINGETLECNWYDVPSLSGSNGLTVQVYDCGSNQPSIANCEKATSSTLLVLSPINQGSPQIVQTNNSGFAHVDGLDGNFTLSETGQQPCDVQSADLGADGTLSLSPDRATTVSVFNCGT